MYKRICLLITVMIIAFSLSACGEAEPAPTPIPPTETPTPLPPTETPTPIPPTETPLPSATPEGFPGWKKFEAGGIELWLPESFEGGDLSQDLEVIKETVGEYGEEFEEFIEIVAENKDMFVFYAIDIDPYDLSFVTNVNVTFVEAISALQIDDLVTVTLEQLPDYMTATENELMTIGGYDGAKLVLRYILEGAEVAQVVYFIKDEGTFWTVTYSTGGRKFDELMPIFEQSISTFKITE